jgi:predicted CopG family antitoxin
MSTVVIESSGTRGRTSRFKRIVISERNYLALKKLGYAGDSFNDVISKLIRIERIYQEMKKQQEEVGQQQQENRDNSSNGLPCIPIPSTEFEELNKQHMAELVQLLRSKRRGSIGRNNQTIKQESNR